MSGPNDELADLLAELAALYRAQRRDRFRPRAYERAARVVRATPVDVTELDESEVKRLGGIGAAIASMIDEYRRTGTVAVLEALRSEQPPGFGALLRLPLIGARDARTLAGQGLTDLASLRVAAGRADGLEVLGERLAARVRESLRRFDAVAGEGTPWPMARREAEAVATAVAALEEVEEAIVAGAVRRGVDIVEAFDLVVVGPHPKGLLATAATSRAVVRVVDDGAPATVVTSAGAPARIWTTDDAGRGPALLHATGPAEHVAAVQRAAAARGLALHPGGVFRGGERVTCRDETEVYRAAGLHPVAPELRSGRAEVDAAAEAPLPPLVTLDDVRGDLHVHSDWSGDGRASLDEMVAAAAGRGYRYVAMTDHAENLSINGMSRDEVRQRRSAIAEVRDRHPAIRVLEAAELNIGLDGGLDYDAEMLGEFDVGVASIHSHMDRDQAQQTDRILAAVAHPAVHVIGHMTGRIIGHRPGYEVDLAAIAQAAAETGTALEVNGSPRRLDLSGPMVGAAIQAGAMIAISSDAHTTDELEYVVNAVAMARNGAAEPAAVVNCLPADAFVAWIAAKRRRA